MFRFWRGWVCVRICGNTPERFLNLCRNHGIVLWNVTTGERESGCGCSMYWKDYRNCGFLAKKAGVVLICEEEHGLYVYIRRYRYRQAFFAACVLLLFGIWFSSWYLWDIQIENNLYYTDDQILSCLKEHGIQKGVLKKRVDCEEIEQMLRDTFERVSWIAATVDGTILKIDVAENYGTLQVEEADASPKDLVAQMDGVVDSFVVRKGVSQIKVGDTVTKGQVLVSGSVPRHNDAQEIVGYEFVHADADVMLKSAIPYKDNLKAEKEVKIYTKKKGAVYHIRFAGRNFSFPGPSRLFWQLLDSNNERTDCLGSGFSEFVLAEPGISLYFYKEEQRAYEMCHVWMQEKEAKAVLQKKLEQFLENLQKNKDVVVENQVRIYYDSVVYCAEGEIVVLRPQTEYQSIDYSAYEIKSEPEEDGKQDRE